MDRPAHASGQAGAAQAGQAAARTPNERIVLTLLRRHGPLAQAEIARLAGLSPQTVSLVMRTLEADGLIARGSPRRGRVGQPSVPMRLAPGGAYFLGLKVGRRSLELVLTDFLGSVLDRAHRTHRFPTPAGAVAFVREAATALTGRLPAAARDRVAGLGIGLPFHLWDWAEPLGVPAAEMAVWRDTDLRAEIAAELPFPVLLENDATAACNAEIVLGAAAGQGGARDFLYAYIGYFAGGGLVLGGRLVTGRTGNAGALGSVPVPAAAGGSVQLLGVASLAGLEAMLTARGLDPAAMWDAPEGWALDAQVLDRWTRAAAGGLAHAAAAGAALLDLEAMVIDGWLPAALRARLVAETAAALTHIDLSGTAPPEIREGAVGPAARALGAASLPLSARFMVDAAAPWP